VATSGSAANKADAGGEKAEDLIAAARKLLDGKNPAGALDALSRAMALPDCTADLRVDAADVFVAAGDKGKAVSACLDAGTHFLYDMGDMPKARAAFAQAHQLDPGNLDVIFQMGQADVVEGRTQDALAKFIDVLRKSNLKHIPALFEAGCIYQANGQYDQAILAFKKVLDRDKAHVQAIVHMGQLHQTKGMVPESLGYYLQAAEIARESGQFGTSQQLCNMVLALDGNNQKARFMLDDLAERHADAELAAQQPAPEPAQPVAVTPPSTVAGASAPAPGSAAASKTVTPDIAKSVNEARLTLDAIAAERAEMQKEMEELSAARLDAEYALARAKDEAEAAVSQRTAALADRSRIEADLAALTESVTRSRVHAEEAARRKAELDAEVAAATTALTAAKKVESEASASAEKRRAQIEDELSELAAKRAAAETAAAAAAKVTTAAQARLAKVEAEVQKLQSDGASLALLTERQEVTRTEVQAAEAERDKVRAEVAALEARLAELAQAQKADEAVAARAAEAQKEAQAQADALAARQAEAQREAQAQADVLAAQIAEAQKEAQAQADALAARQAEAQKEAQAQADALAARQAAAQKESDAAVDKRDALRSELASVEAQLSTLQQQVKTASAGAADAKKLQSASAKLKELDASAQAAAAKLAETNAAVDALDARKREVEEAYARAKSLATAAEEKRAEATRAAEQAEALRTKREADAEALGGRIASLESALKDLDAKATLVAGENVALQELTAKVQSQRHTLQEIETAKNDLERQREEAHESLARLRQEITVAQAALEESRAEAVQAPAALGGEPRRRMTDQSYAEAVVATVPPQSCGEALRTIESLAAGGEIPFEIAAELAGLIHEGRAIEALRVARARANLEAKPAPYLLAVGDLSRDLGDAAAAREAYRTLIAAEPGKSAIVQQRMGQLFLTFADEGTAAALARDDAHYAFAQEPAKALEAYAELVARFPNDPSFRQELGEVHERLGNAQAAGLAYTQAMTQYLAGDDAAKAVDLVSKLLAVRPDSGDALELAARALERAGRTAEAQRTLDDALQAYRRSKSASDVERVCRRLAEIADDPVPYRRELAALLKEVGDIGGAAEQLLEGADRLLKWSNAADALALLREAAALSGDAEPLRDRIAAAKEKAVEAQGSIDAASRAAMFLSKKQFDKAAEAYRAAVDKNPYNADACYQLACLLSDHFPDYATAEQLLDNAAELRPGHTATRYRLALVKAARGQVEQAVELLVALARFDENNADFIDQFVERLEKDADGGSVAAKYRLGIAYRELGRVEEALVILQSIQREAEFIVLCLNAIGLCLRRQGLDTAAAKRFQKAIETPGYPENQYNEALYNLGDLYEAKRDPESLALSLSSFEELYARDCTFRDVADRIKSVKSKLGAAEGPKVKRLPNRSEAANDR
jgi:tetratricopeptide (TPR) repeat protein